MNNLFNPKKIDKLNLPERLRMIPPEYIWGLLKAEKHDTKVEIGAGAGIFSRAFQKLSGTGKTYALDISGDMVDWMNENIVSDNPDVIPMLTEGTDLPLADDFADIVFMITVHHELENQNKTLREARRILKSGGKIFIVDFSPDGSRFGPPVEIRSRSEDVVIQMRDAGFINISSDSGIENFFLVMAEA